MEVVTTIEIKGYVHLPNTVKLDIKELLNKEQIGFKVRNFLLITNSLIP